MEDGLQAEPPTDLFLYGLMQNECEELLHHAQKSSRVVLYLKCAFKTIDHNLLLAKLTYFNFTNSEIKISL